MSVDIRIGEILPIVHVDSEDMIRLCGNKYAGTRIDGDIGPVPDAIVGDGSSSGIAGGGIEC